MHALTCRQEGVEQALKADRRHAGLEQRDEEGLERLQRAALQGPAAQSEVRQWLSHVAEGPRRRSTRSMSTRRLTCRSGL